MSLAIQLILVGSIVVIIIVILLYLWTSFIFNRKFREDMSTMRDKEHFPMPHFFWHNPQLVWDEYMLFFRELYLIWIGRIFDIASTGTGYEKRKIGREHYLSVLVWILIIGGIAMYFSGIYVRDFWSFLLILTVGATCIYAQWKAWDTITSAYPD